MSFTLLDVWVRVGGYLGGCGVMLLLILLTLFTIYVLVILFQYFCCNFLGLPWLWLNNLPSYDRVAILEEKSLKKREKNTVKIEKESGMKEKPYFQVISRRSS